MNIPTSQRKFLDIISRPTAPWKAILGLIAFFSLCFLLGLGKVLIPLYPLLSFLVAVYLYFKSPPLYIGFSFWMLFLGAIIRRIIDYQSGYLTPGPWTFATSIVLLVSSITILQELPKIITIKSYQKTYFPFILCFGCFLYGFFCGFVQNPTVSVLVDVLNYICPFSFAFHIFANWRRYPQYKNTIQHSFFWGILCMGLYGIWQFFTAPLWDRFWMIQAQTVSFGIPEPLGIRTMSTMASPQAFAATMMAGLILLFTLKPTNNILYYPIAIFGYLTFLLSQARAGWLSFIISLFFYVSSLNIKKQIKLIIVVLFIFIVLSQLIYVEPFSSMVLDRFATFINFKTDVSLITRKETFQDSISYVFLEFVGKGFGADYFSLFGDSTYGNRDGSILQTLFVFGWIGSTLLVIGLLLLIIQLLLKSFLIKKDSFASATLAITLGIIGQSGFNYIFLDSIGIVFWGFLGITLAAQKYNSFQINQNKLIKNYSSSYENQFIKNT